MVDQIQDKTIKKTVFQKQLERMVSRKIIITILIGCIFFSVAIIIINLVKQELNKSQHLDDLTDNFCEIYQSTENFLLDDTHMQSFLKCIQEKKEANEIRYMVSKYNAEALVGLHLILTDKEDTVVFTGFSEEKMNLHRKEFNRIASENAVIAGGQIYSTVYYFSGKASEYVMVVPLFQNEQYVGSVTAYLEESDMGKLFSMEQYDAIITNTNGAIIFCTNSSFLAERNTNKYKLEKNPMYVFVNEKRYLTGKRILKDHNIILYSFIYAPKSYFYIFIGMLTIIALGGIWTVMFMRMLATMSGKTAESVGMLVNEIRIIRKKDPNHEIEIHTGDEIEEIASQINKMIKSINELNRTNLELVQINSRMEMQNLQEQMNPHFIYNTLDNIRFLIIPEPHKAEELITRFTHILRYSINNTKKSVCLKEDLKYIEDYLVIQKTRFGERFQYEIEVPKECLEVCIPKLLIQPLIENSIKYGFRKRTDISVKIRAAFERQMLVLSIEDNGAGQPKAMLEMLRSMIQKEEIDTTHNGLQNINRRIQLEYGPQSGMTLESVEGEYFKVDVRLSMNKRN